MREKTLTEKLEKWLKKCPKEIKLQNNINIDSGLSEIILEINEKELIKKEKNKNNLKTLKDLEKQETINLTVEINKNGNILFWGYKQAIEDSRNLAIKWIKELNKKYYGVGNKPTKDKYDFNSQQIELSYLNGQILILMKIFNISEEDLK